MGNTADALLPADQLQCYFRRIGLQSAPAKTIDGLNNLLTAQITNIPFDSIDVWATGQVPSLDTGDLFEKIVMKHRGGYCFELNTLFRVVLNSLGFDAYQTECCLINEDGSLQPPAHNVIICNLLGEGYFIDVGFGGPVPNFAMPLREGDAGNFRLSQSDGCWFLSRIEENTVKPFFRFREIPMSVTELIPHNFYISQLPTSHFRHIIHVNQRNADGSVYALDGNAFKIHKDGGVTVRYIHSVAELKTLLREFYRMDPDQIPLRDSI